MHCQPVVVFYRVTNFCQPVVVFYRVTNFLPKTHQQAIIFYRKKLNFHFWFSPIFRLCQRDLPAANSTRTESWIYNIQVYVSRDNNSCGCCQTADVKTAKATNLGNDFLFKNSAKMRISCKKKQRLFCVHSWNNWHICWAWENLSGALKWLPWSFSSNGGGIKLRLSDQTLTQRDANNSPSLPQSA